MINDRRINDRRISSYEVTTPIAGYHQNRSTIILLHSDSPRSDDEAGKIRYLSPIINSFTRSIIVV